MGAGWSLGSGSGLEFWSDSGSDPDTDLDSVSDPDPDSDQKHYAFSAIAEPLVETDRNWVLRFRLKTKPSAENEYSFSARNQNKNENFLYFLSKNETETVSSSCNNTWWSSYQFSRQRPCCIQHLLQKFFLSSWATKRIQNTHTHLTALCPGLPGWAGTRKVKPVWILLKQETLCGRGISWAICKSAPRSRQITMPAPHHSVFTSRMPFLPPNQQSQSTEGSLNTE